jgi:copper chaperone CopZ
MMSSSQRRPVAFGLLGGISLIALYLGIVRLGSASWPHTVELLVTDWYFVAAVATGFGIQIGLFTHLRQILRQNGGLRSATAMAAGGTATSTTSMVACCLHHLTEVLPLIGLSGAAIFFTTYKVPVILFGLATNGLGIAIMLRAIRRHSRAIRPSPRSSPQGGASCVATVEGAVKHVGGVHDVSVNLAAGKAFITYDSTVTGLGAVEHAIRDVGCGVGRETLRRGPG